MNVRNYLFFKMKTDSTLYAAYEFLNSIFDANSIAVFRMRKH